MVNLTQLHIYCDGGARGNPGSAGIGVVILTPAGKNLAELSKRIGMATNNEAEYQAVIEALLFLKQRGVQKIEINFYLDSNLVVNQLNGQFKIKKAHLKLLRDKAITLIKELNVTPTFNYVPREQNFRADLLLNRALDSK